MNLSIGKQIRTYSLIVIAFILFFFIYHIFAAKQNAANTGISFTVTLYLHGVGLGGDNTNPQGSGNHSPQHLQRTITLLFTDTNNQTTTIPGNVLYNNTSGNFTGTIDGSILRNGSYLVYVKTDGYLEKKVPGIMSITQGQTTNIPSVSLTDGDINNDNQLDVLDYNILLSCYGSKQNTPSCLIPPTAQSAGADIDDSGIIDGADYNLFLRELSVQQGDGNPTPSGQPSPTLSPTAPPPGSGTPNPVISNPPQPAQCSTCLGSSQYAFICGSCSPTEHYGSTCQECLAQPTPIHTQQYGPPPFPIGEISQLPAPPQPTPAALASNWKIIPNVPYCTINGQTWLVDIYQPNPLPSIPMPVIEFFHGGGGATNNDAFKIGRTPMSAHEWALRYLINDGWTALSMGYPVSMPAAVQFAKCGVRYMRQNAALYHIDPKRIVSWGSSWGGNPTNYSSDAGVADGYDVGPYLNQSSRVEADIDWYGINTTETNNHLITSDDPPTLVQQGAVDGTVHWQYSYNYFHALLNGGVFANWQLVGGAGHQFAGGNTNPDYQDIAKTMLQFIDYWVKNNPNPLPQ